MSVHSWRGQSEGQATNFNELKPLDSVVRRELRLIMPRIADLLAQTVGADACSFFVYDESASRTVAAFKQGYAQVLFPQLADADNWAPLDVPIEAEILHTRRSIRRSTNEDFARWPLINSELLEHEDHYRDVVVPLVWHDMVHGVVYLWRWGRQVGFTDEEVRAAEDLAQLAAMAVVFARQYGQEREQRQQLDALLEVATLAASPRTIEEVAPHLTRAIRSATGADVCLLYVLDEDATSVLAGYGDGLNVREQWVFDSSHAYPVASVPVELELARTLEPKVVTDMEVDLAPGSELVVYAQEARLKEILVSPIVYQRAMVGVVYCWYRDPHRAFGQRAIETVQAIADQAGGVVSRARLHESSQQHMQETEALLRIGQAVLASDTLNSVLDEIAHSLAQTIPYEYCYVAFLNPDQTGLKVARHWGRFHGFMLDDEIPLDRSLAGVAVTTGQILNVADTLTDHRTLRFPYATIPIRSVLIAPLVTDHGTIGALYVGRHRAGYFSARQERLMELLSQQAATAIERVRSRQSLALRAQRQTFLATVVDRLVAEDDPERAIREIARAACGMLADGVVFGLASWKHGQVDWVVGEHWDPDIRQRLMTDLVPLDDAGDRDALERLLLLDDIEIRTPEDPPAVSGLLTGLLDAQIIQQLMIVPLFQSERARGLMILLATDASTAFDREVAELASVVAGRIGDALERKQLSRNQDALLRSSEALNGKMQLSQIIDVFYAELQSIIPCDQFYLSATDSDPRERVAILANTPWISSRERVPMPAELGLTGVALCTGQAILENNAHVRPESYYPSDEEAQYYREHGESVMIAPLISEGRVIGSLFVGRGGANRFSHSEYETFLLFAGLAAAAIDRTELAEQNHKLYRASVEVLAAVVDAKDPTTLEHSRNVAHYSRHAAEMMRLSGDEVERIELAGLMHDIGKLSIPDHVLSKPGRLNEVERRLINDHPTRGAKILEQHPALTGLVPLVRHHHERWDGRGYPDGLSGYEIPLGASMIAVADAFDTMTSERTYQTRQSVDDALRELERCAGTQFHPAVVERFVTSIRRNRSLLRTGVRIR